MKRENEREREPERLSSKVVGSITEKKEDRSRDFSSDRLSSKVVGSIPEKKDDRKNFETLSRERSDRRDRERMEERDRERERRGPPNERRHDHDLRVDRHDRRDVRNDRRDDRVKFDRGERGRNNKFDSGKIESSARGWATQGNNLRGGSQFHGGRGRPTRGRWGNVRRENQDPLNIPKSGYYYEHDDREGDTHTSLDSKDTKDIDKWGHDLYKEQQENIAKVESIEAINNENANNEANQSAPPEHSEEGADDERPIRRRRFEETDSKDQLEEDNETKEHGSPISEEHLV